MKLARMLLPTLAALLFAVPAVAQEARACPDVEPGDVRPIELRIAGVLLRVQVAEQPMAVAEGTSVDVRLVACEEEAGSEAGRADEAAAAGERSGLLRVLHDLRLGVAVGPSADGRCMRARFDLPRDSAAGPDAAAPPEPLRFELCGFSWGAADEAEDAPRP
ncbi:MAG TPA: hypothetical protein VMK65_12390 [Longimicrobiales bacterium]|nr:hypothetical protein [Longimicrobiales bacterium]